MGVTFILIILQYLSMRLPKQNKKQPLQLLNRKVTLRHLRKKSTLSVIVNRDSQDLGKILHHSYLLCIIMHYRPMIVITVGPALIIKQFSLK